MAENPASNPSAADPGVQDEKARARARLGKTIKGKYRLDSLLGVGGMASVFGSTHRNGSRVALKILHTEFARDVGIRDRFLREGYVANRVDHPGRVAILDDDVTESDEPFLVMELLEGETLQQMWKRMGRKVPIPEALEVAQQSLDTLEAFHKVGIVHRDIKPANIFVTKEKRVMLLDFGVARMREAGGDKTRAGTALGTPSFMAPEQAMGLTEGIDGRADVFSIGATLYAILSGQRLHQGRSDNEAFILAATQPAPSLARVAPDLPVEMIALVDKALAWDPRSRFDSAEVMRQECLRLLAPYKPGVAAAAAAAAPAAAQPAAFPTAAAPQAAPAAAEPAPEPPATETDPAVVRLTDLFRRIERLLPAVRQYGWAHPEADNKLRACFQGLMEALREDSNAVYWSLLPYSFTHRQQTVWEPAPPFDVVPYNLFAAGIRTFRITPGVTEQELRGLCEVLLLDPARDLTPEDDVASALWERRLKFIKYDVINVFAEGDAADREAFYEEADQLENVAQRAADERANRAEAAAMNVTVDAEALRVAKAAAQVLALDPVAKKAIGAQLETSPERWSERFVDVLADAFVDTTKRKDVKLVSEPLDASARDLVLSRRFDVLFPMWEAIRRSIEGAVRNQRPPLADPRSVGPTLTRAMFGPDTLRLLIVEAVRSNQQAIVAGGAAAAQGVAIDLDRLAQQLNVVLSELGHEHVAPIVGVLDQVPHEGLRQVLFAFLQRTMAGRENEIAERIPQMSIETARPLLRLLAAIRTQGGFDALRRLAASGNPTLRCESVAYLAQTPEQLKDELGRLAEAPQPELRQAALRTMAFHQVRAAGPLLVKRVQDPTFNQLPVGERRELLTALFALNPQRGEQIAVEIVQKHGLLVDESLEQTRALCAELLGQHAKSMEALDAVLQASKRRWWNTQPLRDAALVAAETIAQKLGRRISPAGEVI
ncbi:MAG: serine/threonine protein kinase [Polyangiaceae bacterium]|nr:serine/threonine protein kinase [Polyangiaceae bacterium]